MCMIRRCLHGTSMYVCRCVFVGMNITWGFNSPTVSLSIWSLYSDNQWEKCMSRCCSPYTLSLCSYSWYALLLSSYTLSLCSYSWYALLLSSYTLSLCYYSWYALMLFSYTLSLCSYSWDALLLCSYTLSLRCYRVTCCYSLRLRSFYALIVLHAVALFVYALFTLS